MAILRLRRCAAALVALMMVAAGAPEVRAQGGLEYEVKAAFVYNFIKFVEWPAEALAAESFRVCLLGEDPFGGLLERVVHDDNVEGLPIAVERVPPDGTLTSCHIVFVPRAYASRTAAIARTLGNAPVLLVGESPGFLRAGGAIGLVVDGGHVRFDVAIPQATARGLKISSKLLRVARNTGGAQR